VKKVSLSGKMWKLVKKRDLKTNSTFNEGPKKEGPRNVKQRGSQDEKETHLIFTSTNWRKWQKETFGCSPMDTDQREKSKKRSARQSGQPLRPWEGEEFEARKRCEVD